jgi:Zn-finger domain-containing protein
LQKKNQREIIAKRNLCKTKKVPQKHSAKEFMQKIQSIALKEKSAFKKIKHRLKKNLCNKKN